MPQIGANFQFTSRQPNFERDQFDTIAHMAACTVCDEGHKCYCLENQKTYEFTSVDSNGDAIEPNETTGYWHEFSSGGSGDVTGATIGSGASEQNVTKVGSILKFPAYPTVPVKGIKDANGNDINPDINGKVTLPAAATAPITKIKVEGASSDLPIDEGRVVIPSTPVKGIQTSNGTALAPNGSGIVTLPVIPADPTTRINNAEKRIAALESELGGDPAPVVIPVSAVNLPHTAGSTFTYDPDDTYVMNISDVQIATVCYPYDHTIGAATTSYLIFKAIDRDLYYVYTHNTSTDLCTYFEEKIFDELSHEEAKAVFEAGKYAVKQIINAATGEPRPLKYWKHGIPNVFVTPHGFPLRCTTMSELINGTRHYYTLLKCDENQRIFKYEASNNKWSLVSGGCLIKGDTNTGDDYEKYDAYFDKKPASDITFDDENINIGADNVQDAIRIAFTNIQSTTCTLNLTVYKDSTVLANKSVHIDVTYQGIVSSTLSGDYTTSSQGIISVSLPLGSVYTITFSDETNYRKPDTINGIADNNIKNITALYEPVAENEKVIVICTVKNTTSVYPNNKIAYIHYTNSDYSQNISVNPEWTLTFGTNGSVKTIVHNGNVETECLIPFGTYYTVELADWDSSEEQAYSKSAIVKTRALSETRVINVYYSYLLSGLFVVIKDNSDNVYGYTSYKVTNTDTTNNITTILMNDIEYDIRYTAGVGVQKSLKGQNDYSTWIAAADMDSTIIGVGVRDSTLINSTALDSDGMQQGYTNCCFMLCKVTYPTTTYSYINAGPDYKNADCKDGRFITNLAASQEVDRPVIRAVVDITKQTGNHTQHAFLASGSQWSALYLNYNNIKSIGSSLNINISIASNTTYWLSTAYYVNATRTGNDFGSLAGYNPGNYTGATPDKSYRLVPLFSFN